MRETILSVLFAIAIVAAGYIGDNVIAWDEVQQKERLRCAPKSDKATWGPAHTTLGQNQCWTYYEKN